MKPEQQLTLLSRGTAEVISPEYLLSKLKHSNLKKTPLVVKAGFDPSSPDIHLGHTVLLRKLRQFQELGHKVVFIIGDATARVGDPSGHSQTRPMLSEAQIKANASTYRRQAFKILDPQKTETIFNNQWFGAMSFFDMMLLASKVTVSQILERDDFKKRLSSASSVSLMELFYPLMQAYDSVMIKSDIELGGTDQKFNLLLGRALQKEFGQEPQAVITLPLLVGLDGVQKMSKSLGNHIGIEDLSTEIFGKIMSISDAQMEDYFTLLTDQDGSKINADIKSGKLHPKAAKEELALKIVSSYHGEIEAKRAQGQFIKVFTQKENPSDMDVVRMPAGNIGIVKLLTESGLIDTGNEARRLVRQNAVTIDGVICDDPQKQILISTAPIVIKVGKRRFIRITSA